MENVTARTTVHFMNDINTHPRCSMDSVTRPETVTFPAKNTGSPHGGLHSSFAPPLDPKGFQYGPCAQIAEKAAIARNDGSAIGLRVGRHDNLCHVSAIQRLRRTFVSVPR